MSAPDMQDLHGVIDFSRIADPHARDVMSQMHAMAHQRHIHDNAFQQTVLTRLEELSQSATVSFRDNGPPPPPQLFPFMIQAADADLCASSHGSSGSLGPSSAAASVAADPAEYPLECPFCGARHNNEKSHVQHLSRLLRRMGKVYGGLCFATSEHRVMSHPDVPSNTQLLDKLAIFVTRYNSCLASSRDNGVDPIRLAALQKFMNRIPNAPQ